MESRRNVSEQRKTSVIVPVGNYRELQNNTSNKLQVLYCDRAFMHGFSASPLYNIIR